ncbi:hypothetical protein ACHAXT_005991 [Thalassiosira profunda]
MTWGRDLLYGGRHKPDDDGGGPQKIIREAVDDGPLQLNEEEDAAARRIMQSTSDDGTPSAAVYDDDKDDRKEELASLTTINEAHGLRRCPPEVLNSRSLARDTFSFLVFAGRCSAPSLLASIVFSLQMAIFILVSADVIDLDNELNPFNFPPNVELPVRITEVLAITVAILTQDDVRKAINLLRDGYDDAAFRSAFGSGVAKSKWMLSIVLRGSEGLLGLFVTFLLIMQSDAVLDLLLNFSAMEFVSLIDDVVFALTTEGFFGSRLRGEAKSLSSIKYRIDHPSNARMSSLITAAYFIVLFAAMLTGWGLIFANQESGKYLCGKLYVQLDDEMVPSLGTLSGMYQVNRYLKFSGRVTYINPVIAYCGTDSMWTITQHGGGELDPCVDWIARSSESSDFDITEADSWYARTEDGRVLPMYSYFQCYDCKYKSNFCGETSSYGTCVENTCVCADGRYGLRCEFEEPCDALELDPRSNGIVGNQTFASTLYRLEGADVNNRPIYTSSLQDVTNIDILMFNGRRWIITDVGSLPLVADRLPSSEGINQTDVNQTADILRSYLGNGFHPSFSSYNVSYISEAVDIDTRADMSASPLALEWHPALPPDGNVQGPDLSRSVGVRLICAESTPIFWAP